MASEFSSVDHDESRRTLGAIELLEKDEPSTNRASAPYAGALLLLVSFWRTRRALRFDRGPSYTDEYLAPIGGFVDNPIAADQAWRVEMTGDESARVKIKVKRGYLSPEKVQDVLDLISTELSDPASETSRLTSELGLTVSNLEVEQNPAFVLEAFLIAMAVKFAGGAAGAGGALFFNRILKPRFTRIRADAIGEIDPDTGTDAKKDAP